MDKQWMILIAVMAITILYPKETKSNRIWCVRWAALALILFAGFRSWWMGDLLKYYTAYLKSPDVTFGGLWEEYGFRNIGLPICFKVMYTFFGTQGYDYFIFISSAFSVGTLSKVIARYSPSPYLSYLMFICMGLYGFTYTGMKQTVAMGFCCLAMLEVLDGTFMKFLLFVLLAYLFHSPALIFLFAWPLCRKRVDTTYFLIIAVLIIAVFAFRSNIAYLLEDTYHSEEAAEALASSGEIVGGRFIMMMAILIGSTFFRPPTWEDKYFSRTFGVIVLAAICQMFSIYNNNYTRLADYFFQFIAIYTPMFLDEFEYYPDGRRRRYGALTNRHDIYILALVVITVFSLWFYRNQIPSFQSFKFFWELDAHHMYGA